MKPVPNYVTCWRYLIAIIPVYKEDSKNATEVYYLDGKKETYDCRCETIAEHLARKFHTSTELIRSQSGLLLTEADSDKRGEKCRVPLVLQDRFCLVPIKFREKKKHNDSTIGYIVLQYVDRVVDLPDGGSRILFYISTWAPATLQRRKTVESQLQRAWTLQKWFGEEIQDWEKDNSSAKDRLTSRHLLKSV